MQYEPYGRFPFHSYLVSKPGSTLRQSHSSLMAFAYSELFREFSGGYSVYINRIQDPLQLYLEAYGVSGHLVAHAEERFEKLLLSGFMMQTVRMKAEILDEQRAGLLTAKDEVVGTMLERLRPLMQPGALSADPVLVAVVSGEARITPDLIACYTDAHLPQAPLGYVSIGNLEASRVVSTIAQREGAALFVQESPGTDTLPFPITHALVIDDSTAETEERVLQMKALGALPWTLRLDA